MEGSEDLAVIFIAAVRFWWGGHFRANCCKFRTSRF